MLNAANEVIVAAFLARKLRFCEIAECVGRVVEDMREVSSWHGYDDIMAADRLARRSAEALVARMSNTFL